MYSNLLKLPSKNLSNTVSQKKITGCVFVPGRRFSEDVSMKLVKELRVRTQAGYTDCKKALVESNGDMDKAIDWLRKKGALKAASKTDRVTAEGIVGMCFNRTTGVLVEMNSETDFVARGETFTNLAKNITGCAMGTVRFGKGLPAEIDLDMLKQAVILSTKQTVQEAITETIAKLGENIRLRRGMYLSYEPGRGMIAGYMHNVQEETKDGIVLGKIGALVSMEVPSPDHIVSPILQELGKRLAAHVVGFSPEFIKKDQVTPEVIEKYKKHHEQKQIEDRLTEEQKRPFNVNRVYDDICLYDQYTIDGSRRVRDVIEEASKQLGAPIEIRGFVRMARGEGIEKKETDFAKEVNDLVSGSKK